MLPCYDEAGKQRVSEAGKGQVHTGHTTVHPTSTSGHVCPSQWLPAAHLPKSNPGSDVLELSTQTASSPHTGFVHKFTFPCHHPSLWRGRKGDSGYLFHLENSERCFQISRELSNSPINILTQAKVLFLPVTKPRAERSITLRWGGGWGRGAMNPHLGQEPRTPKGNRIPC